MFPFYKNEWRRFSIIRLFLPFCKCKCSARLVIPFRLKRLRLKRRLLAWPLAALSLSIRTQAFTGNSVGTLAVRMIRKCTLLFLLELDKLLISVYSRWLLSSRRTIYELRNTKTASRVALSKIASNSPSWKFIALASICEYLMPSFSLYFYAIALTQTVLWSMQTICL